MTTKVESACSILAPEGFDKFGWKSFLAMITFKHNNVPSKRLRSEIKEEILLHAIDLLPPTALTSLGSHARALTHSSEDENRKKHKIDSDDHSSSKRSSTTDFRRYALSGKAFDKKKKTMIVTRRYFHDDWSRTMSTVKIRQTS